MLKWDLFHIRLMEQMMLVDNKESGPYILPYFATADVGLKDALEINPIKAFIIINGEYAVIHQKSINDIPVSHELKQMIGSSSTERRNMINNTDFSFEKRRLLEKIMQIKFSKIGK